MHASGIENCIDQQKLQAISNAVLHKNDGQLIEWSYHSIGTGERNFVTGGVFRVTGITKLRDAERRSWSVILKVVKQDPTCDSTSHYNYWRREVEAYQSGLLQQLPANFVTPKCFSIDHLDDGSIWLWLEDVGHELQQWDKDAYRLACKRLGQFQAAYLVGETLPSNEWINSRWMRSWIQECMSYRSELDEGAIEQLLSDERLSAIMLSLNQLEDAVGDWISALERLPRVFAHQDYYEQNILLRKDQQPDDPVMLIDWQFASISGIGEDLGRFLGLAVSRGHVPIEHFAQYRELFFASYMEGLRESGWTGESELSRFGFIASFAMRAVWEAPKLLRWFQNKPGSSDNDKLLLIVQYQMEAAMEAAELYSQLTFKHS
ncbi:phosphotransferase [Paenibacillus cellulosilyticus]|nr:phosphotransferase [Paenibacillus cellulosilyticus]QKS45876.1 phosphotransferase [Paenibacillus cellulosilyticus]